MKAIRDKLKSVLSIEDDEEAALLTDEEYTKNAEQCLKDSWQLINSDGWKEEKKTTEGDVIESKVIEKGHKIFKITGKINIPPKIIYNELSLNIEQVPDWNKTITANRMIKKLSDKVSITYQVTAEGGGGIVAPRDFVTLRCCDMIEENYVCSGVSILHPDMPPQKGIIRGHNGPGCWVMRPIPDDPNSCIFQWLLDSTLRGWITQSVCDIAMPFALTDYMQYTRIYGEFLKEQGKF